MISKYVWDFFHLGEANFCVSIANFMKQGDLGRNAPTIINSYASVINECIQKEIRYVRCDTSI